MQAENEQKQPWRFKLRAKGKRFDFKLKATKDSPNWNLHRIYVLLKIHKLFFFLMSSESGSCKPERTLKSKFLRFADKFGSIFAKKPHKIPKAGTKKYLDQLQLCAKEVPPNCFSYLIIAAIGLGFGLQKGTFFKYGLVILLLIIYLLMKRCEAGKSGNKLCIMLIATVLACYSVFGDLNIYYYMKNVESYGPRWVQYWSIWRIVETKIWGTLCGSNFFRNLLTFIMELFD